MDCYGRRWICCSINPSSELQGKDILLSFRPASAADEEIYNSYATVFDVPAYAVSMQPVLLVNGEVVAEGEDYLCSTLGTGATFTMHIVSGGKTTTVTNAVTTGSMYAVTLDNQSITPDELQRVYDETAALKDSVTEENVYSEEYLGKLLALAGKLYFAQVDIADMVATEMYDVISTRSLSEGITGYEVKKGTLYGQVTSLSEGSLYIDVDTDSHTVVSLTGDKDVPKEYMLSTGMLSSLYESTVWEQLTGYESVSTISIFAKAKEQDIDILVLSSANLSTELEKLNTDETTRWEVINAVNNGMIVTIPSQNVTMGEWSGTGYMVTNPETGAGAYMISGGLNGGMLAAVVTVAVLCTLFSSVLGAAMLVGAIIEFIGAIVTPFLLISVSVLLALFLVAIVEFNRQMLDNYLNYIITGNLDVAVSASEMAVALGEVAIAEALWVKQYRDWMNKKYASSGGVEGSSNAIPMIDLNVNPQQLGKKWGKHKYDYPQLSSYNEYEELAKYVFNNPDKIVLDSINGEYFYIKGTDLLRITLGGEFISLYPGVDTALVKKALEGGGLLWAK